MPSSSDIQKKAIHTDSVSYDIRRESGTCASSVADSKTWWQGEAGNTLRDEYKMINQEITSMTGKLGSLKTNLYTLASKVSEADLARQQKAAELSSPKRSISMKY